MIRTSTGHPIRALYGAGLLLIVAAAYRVPILLTEFDAAVAAARDAMAPRVAPLRRWRSQPPSRLAVAFSEQPMPLAADDPPRSIGEVAGRSGPLPLPASTPDIDRVELATLRVIPSSAALPPATTIAVGYRGPPDSAGDFAARAYARLALRDRRTAVRLFDAALAIGGDPRDRTWRTQRDALTRRWSGSAYSIVRGAGAIDLAVTPVLGGGQSGAALAWSPDPLASHPLALTVRATVAHDDGRSALAAVGVAWRPIAGVTLAAERLIPVAAAARGDWTARIAGGGAWTKGVIDASAYGEAGVVGSATYAAAQAHLGVSRHGRVAFGSGVGLWASIQHGGGTTVDRVDFGPGITGHAGPIGLSVDYRVRVAGNAAPGSGPVLTVSAAF